MEKTKRSKRSVRTWLSLTLVWMMVAALVIFASAATSGNGQTANGEFTWSWSVNNTKTNAAGTVSGSVSENTLTIQIGATSSTYTEGSDGCGGVGATAEVLAESTTNTVTLTNKTGATIEILSVNTSSATCSTAVGVKMANGATFTVSATGAPNSTKDKTARTTTGTVVITYRVIENIDLTYFGADGVTYSYGETVLDSASAAVALQVEVGCQVTLPEAPAVTNGTFLGWRIGHDSSLRNAGETVTIDNDSSIYPVVAAEGQVAPFTVGGNSYMFWTDAMKAAGANGTVILNQSYTLPTTLVANGVGPAGTEYVSGTDGNVNYIIPRGVNLLIPFSEAHVFRGIPKEYSLKDMSLSGSSFPDTPEVGIVDAKVMGSVSDIEYCRLTMVAGTQITVDGALEVSGQTHPLARGGLGNYGSIQMDEGSEIVVNSGASLFAWGYIRGNGTVSANSGSAVYEHFDCLDYPAAGAGGLDSLNSAGVFGLTNYTINSIEAPLNIHAGAELKIYLVMTGYSIGTNSFIRTFVGTTDSAVFNLISGTITKSVVNGRQKFVISGELKLNPLKIAITGIPLYGSYTVDTSTTSGLPISQSWDLTIAGGSYVTIADSVLVYAGGTVTVDEGAKLTVPSGKNVYLLDADSDPSAISQNAALDINGELQIDGKMYTSTANGNFVGITSSQGTGKIKFAQTASAGTVKIRGTGDNSADAATIPAKLKNTDGSSFTAAATTYIYQDSKWTCENHSFVQTSTTATCTQPGIKNSTCSACGETKVEEAAALGHDMVTDAAVAPGCESTGLTEGSHCSRCDDMTTAQQVVPATGHTPGAEADCENAQTCTVCGTELAPATGHNMVAGTVVAPTCTEDGYTVYTCSNGCGHSEHRDPVTAIGHAWDNDCDTTCNNNCGTTREPSHTPNADDGDCTTAVTCSVCGTETTAAKEAHTPADDDGDCTTAVKCVNCEQNAVAAKDAHVAGEDDGDCTTAVKCVNCEQNAIEAKEAHVAGEDDGDCTTAVKCVNCEQNAVAAKDAHVAGEDDGDCTTAVKCVNCEQNAVAAKDAHVAGEDDGDCTTAVKCVNCEQNAVAAKEAHVAGEDDGDCTTAVKCVNCEQDAVAAKEAHVAGEDDGDCTTAVKCVNCDKIAVEAKGSHTPNEDDGDCTTAITCSDCGTVTTPAKEAHTPAEGSHNCGYCGKPVTECGDYYVTYGDGYIVITNSGIAALKPSTFIQNMSFSILMERIDSLAAWVAEKGYTNALGKEYVDFCYNLGLDPNTMTAEQIANSYVLYAANNIGAMSEEEIYNLIFAEDGSGFDRAVLVYAMVTAYAYATDEALMNELDQQYEVPEFFSTLADIVASPGFISYFESRQGEKDLAAFSATMEMICRSFESTEAVDKILSEGFASDDFIILLEEVIENYSHDCGVCGAQLTECMDDDNNHKCDLCDATLSECADDNNDHKCDVCDATLSECADDNNDHKCDVCDETLSECADGNNDHKCDVCGTEMGTHEAAEGGHDCAYCGKPVTECVDSEKDHICDICQTAMGKHADGDDNDHLCDYGCGEVADDGHHGGNATCTEQATCDECGEPYGEALGHGEKVTYTNHGDTHSATYDCCGETFVTNEAHTYMNGECVCGAVEKSVIKVKVATYSVSLEAEVIMNYYVIIPDELLNDDNAYATMTLAGTNVVVNIPMSEIRASYNSSNGRCKIESGVPSIYMTKNVELRIYDGEGKAVTLYTSSMEDEVYGRSIEYYINSRLSKDIPETERNLLVALATYGGYAQRYFRDGRGNQMVDETPLYNVLLGHNLDPADISGVTYEAVNRVNDRGNNEANMGITLKTFSVALDSAVELTLKFVMEDGYDIDDFTYVLTYNDAGTEKTMALEATKEVSTGRCVLKISDIAAACWDYEYKIEITNNVTGETNIWGSSVLAFVTTKLKSASATEMEKDVVRAMYIYNKAANEHFGI